MNVFISTFLGWGFFIVAVAVCSFFVTLSVWRIQATCEEHLAKRKQRKEERKQKTAPDNVPVLLSPKDRREYILNHIEDGRLYAILSFRSSEICIVCAKRYDAEEERLYCYAYLWISGKGDYNLHIEAPIDTAKSCDFLGKNRLHINLDRNPHLVVFEEENISPYIDDRDYNVFMQSLQAAGFDWKIEKGEDNGLSSYKYRLKETRTK
jgi:hypothetical protein